MDSKEISKVLLIGEERICKQVAYVLVINNYELLTLSIFKKRIEENAYNYNNKIIVCEFKKSKCLSNLKSCFLILTIFNS